MLTIFTWLDTTAIALIQKTGTTPIQTGPPFETQGRLLRPNFIFKIG